jgi:transposase
MTDSKKITRRRHSAELKALVLDECAQPGASVAAIAMAHGINANVVHKWRRLASGAPSAPASPAFVALPVPQAVAAPSSSIRIELRRGAMNVAVDWPLSCASECATWLRELLR